MGILSSLGAVRGSSQYRGVTVRQWLPAPKQVLKGDSNLLVETGALVEFNPCIACAPTDEEPEGPKSWRSHLIVTPEITFPHLKYQSISEFPRRNGNV
jgi:hypothetical protein